MTTADSVMTTNNVTVTVYKSKVEAEAAVKQLERAGFDLKKVSIVGRDADSDGHVGGYMGGAHADRPAGRTGVFWGGIRGMLLGSALFLVPGIGPVLVAGRLVGTIVEATDGAVDTDGLSAIGLGLHQLGIPKDHILRYESELKRDKVVMVAEGSIMEMAHAREVIRRTPAEVLEQHVRLPERRERSLVDEQAAG